jgi:long-chain acyl-CoA synthetase
VNIEAKPLFAILDDAVAKYADNPCLEFLGKKLSYREVGAQVSKAAQGFRDLGVDKGVKVGLFLPNSPFYVVAYYAILKAGGTVVNFNPLYAERQIARQIADSETRIMVTLNMRSLYPKVAARLEDTCLETVVVCNMGAALPFPGNALFRLMKRREIAAIPSDAQHVRFDKLIANDGAFEPVSIDPTRDVAALQYTGGTTGRPKGAKLSHANLYVNCVQTRLWAPDVKPGKEKVLAILPLFHVFGMTGVLNLGLYCGAEIVLMPRFKEIEVLKLIDKQRPSVFVGVPTMYSALNRSKEFANYDLSSLRYCISGGAALPLEVKQTFEQTSGCTLVEGYGLTEAAPVCTINPFVGVNKPGSIGLPLPGTMVKINSLDNPDRPVPLGERGEICVAGPHIMAGYWHRDEETEEVLRGGFLRTGDVGHMDADGYVYLVDRIKDLIINSGFNVYPRVVEEAISEHPAVEEAAVCGIPDSHRGELVKAYVILRNGAELKASDLRTFLKDRLAPFEIPRRVEFRETLPRTLLGKPSRRDLIAEEVRRKQATPADQSVDPSAEP